MAIEQIGELMLDQDWPWEATENGLILSGSAQLCQIVPMSLVLALVTGSGPFSLTSCIWKTAYLQNRRHQKRKQLILSSQTTALLPKDVEPQLPLRRLIGESQNCWALLWRLVEISLAHTSHYKVLLKPVPHHPFGCTKSDLQGVVLYSQKL